ncbi:MAG TPA: single-stranded DNA-binding protein, partial [Candidatus Latescibacteria bacterium]|nr:single-stranded DNA-binding protein [Candidatus Latescibacterota bacterium]
MASVNKVILIGNLGKDPVVDQTPSGTPRCRFSLATSENFTDREGKKQERTEWHNILIWGKLAEVAGQYLRKGRPVYLEGRIAYRSYEDQEGNKKNFTEIVVTSMQLLGSRSDQSGYDSDVPPPEEPLRDEKAEAFEFIALETSEITGRPFKEIHFPRGTIVGAIVRGEEIIIPD